MYEIILHRDAISEPKHFPIDSNRIVKIGRMSACFICIKDKYISSSHAEIRRKEGKEQIVWFLIDGDLSANKPSTNGTFLNRGKLENKLAYILKDGDRITFAGNEYPLLVFRINKVESENPSLNLEIHETISHEYQKEENNTEKGSLSD